MSDDMNKEDKEKKKKKVILKKKKVVQDSKKIELPKVTIESRAGLAAENVKTKQGIVGGKRMEPLKDKKKFFKKKGPMQSQGEGSSNFKDRRPRFSDNKFSKGPNVKKEDRDNKFKTPAKSESASDESKKEKSRKSFLMKKKKDQKGFKKEREEELEKALNFTKKKKENDRESSVPREIKMLEVISISDLAKKMNLKASSLITKLFSMGMKVTINELIDAETANILADEYGSKIKVVSLYEETEIKNEEEKEENMIQRSPIVTVMGHVDHGKTKLLDAIRSSNVVDKEYGGITQHIRAHSVKTSKGYITFIDTPGHEAFARMRMKGASITDIVVLVVSAVEGIMPQTIEAISHAKEAKVPIVVAINKIDLEGANIDKTKQQLAEHGLVPEEWGGDTMYCNISAKKLLGIQELLDSILLQAEVLDLKANYKRKAEARILESEIAPGKGILATVIIHKGTIKLGDFFVAGIHWGKVKGLYNDRGESIKEADPSTPVGVMGFSGTPSSGDPFQVVEDEKTAKQISKKRFELKKYEASRNVKKVTLDSLYENIKEGNLKELKLVIKADVYGSVEAIENVAKEIKNEEVKVSVIQAATGEINENDVMLASSSNALLIAFNTKANTKAIALAQQENIEIKKYNLIYNLVDDINNAVEGLLTPDIIRELIGKAEIKKIFTSSKLGNIAGCLVLDGKVQNKKEVTIMRGEKEILTTKIHSLKKFQDSVNEVGKGAECGIVLEKQEGVEEGDIIEVYNLKKVPRKLKANDKKKL